MRERRVAGISIFIKKRLLAALSVCVFHIQGSDLCGGEIESLRVCAFNSLHMLVNSKPARICISNFSLHWIILIFCSNKTICFGCWWSVLIYTAASPQAWFLFLSVLDSFCGFKRWIFPWWLDCCRFSFLLAVAFCFFRCGLDGLYWKWQGHGARGWGILAISISIATLEHLWTGLLTQYAQR